MATPKISVQIQPETLENLLQPEFKAQAEKLLALYLAAPEILAQLENMVFVCETVAHLRNLEKELLPYTDSARDFIAKFKE